MLIGSLMGEGEGGQFVGTHNPVLGISGYALDLICRCTHNGISPYIRRKKTGNNRGLLCDMRDDSLGGTGRGTSTTHR